MQPGRKPTENGMAVKEVSITLPNPHAAQQQIIDEAKRFNVLAIGRRWGKTTLGADRLTNKAIQGKPVAWYSPSYKMLTELWREMRRTLQPVTTRVSEQEHRIDLYGGGLVDMWSLEVPDASRGRRYATIVIDEAAMVRELQDAWQKAIRPTLTDFQGDAWFMSTPRGLNEFHDLYQMGVRGGDWASWRMPTSTKMFGDARDETLRKELEAAKRDLGPLAYAQEYEAEFTALGDAAFPEVKAETHVIPTDYEMIQRWRKVAGHDYGYGSPSAMLWFAIDPDGGAVAYREWSTRHQHVDEVAQGVQYRQGDESVLIYGDPSLWKMNGKAFLTAEMIAVLAQSGKLDLTIGRQYEEAGMYMQPANNARIAGFLRLHTLFAPRPKDGKPYLRFMDCCPDAFATFQNLQLDPDKDGNDVITDYPQDDPVWRRDEYYDCARYAMMGVPTKATNPEPQRTTRGYGYFEPNVEAAIGSKPDVHGPKRYGWGG